MAKCDMPNQVTTDQSIATGVVINCKKLNLRTKPTKASTVIYEIPAGSALTINKSVNGWLNVCTESGLEGFCMKNFVAIEEGGQDGQHINIH